jgi:7-carboxy-7-deazaguanine synthase
MLTVSKQPNGRAEIFYSIQGEGANMGQPAVFLRLGLCNLKCLWCDTKYTWDWTAYNPQDQLIKLSVREVEQEILGYGRQYLVVTGGEPLVQQDRIIQLLASLKNRGFFTEIETNGTLMPDPRLLNLVDHWSVSPKLQNSGNPESVREIEACYRFFNTLGCSHFKYVLQSETDLRELQELIKKYHLASEKIILMPEARDKAKLAEKSGWLIEICKAHGYLFSTRLQIIVWGSERGK